MKQTFWQHYALNVIFLTVFIIFNIPKKLIMAQNICYICPLFTVFDFLIDIRLWCRKFALMFVIPYLLFVSSKDREKTETATYFPTYFSLITPQMINWLPNIMAENITIFILYLLFYLQKDIQRYNSNIFYTYIYFLFLFSYYFYLVPIKATYIRQLLTTSH